MNDQNQNPGNPPTEPQAAGLQQVQLGEAVINPQWQGHLVAISDNGGDMVMFTVHHPRHGPIVHLWSRTVAAGIRQWLEMALSAPTLVPLGAPAPAVQPPEPPLPEGTLTH